MASAAAIAGLLLASSASAQPLGYPNYPYDNAYNSGTWGYYGNPSVSYTYPNGYAYNYGYPSNSYGPFGFLTAPLSAAAAIPATVASAVTAPITAPLVTGRSVAEGQMGRMCTTPAKSCELYHDSFVGNGCSCRVPGGRARGSVTP